MKTALFFVVAFFPCAVVLSGQNTIPAGGHRGTVTMLLPAGNGRVYSAGADGFLGLWDSAGALAESRFQLSPWGISFMALRPGDEEGGAEDLAVAENGSGRYRISVWDLAGRTKRFSVDFKYPVSFLSYSASGTFLIAATQGTSGCVFIDAETGTALDMAVDCNDRITFAATGKSEKSMIGYSPAGVLSYWDFDTKEEIRRYPVSRSLQSILLFGSRRFFAGTGPEGLSVYDAVSGNLIVREKSVSRGILASDDPESTYFYCMQPNKITLYDLNPWGRLETVEEFTLPSSPGFSCFFPLDGDIILGSSSGELLMLTKENRPKPFGAETAVRIVEGASSGQCIVLLTDEKTLGVIPVDYRALQNGAPLSLAVNSEAYNRITPANPVSGKTAEFILWQSSNIRVPPALWTAEYGKTSAVRAKSVFERLPLQANLRSVSVYKKNVLFLTVRGVVSAVSLEDNKDGAPPDGAPLFSWQTQGTSDAAFLNDNEIILGQSSLSGAPFVKQPLGGGRSVPLDIPASAGIRLYPASERLYGLVSGKNEGGDFTSIVALDTAKEIASYTGEDQNASFAELSGAVAVDLGGESACIYAGQNTIPFERDPGFPLRILSGVNSFVVLDTDGNIAWHDPETGKTQARLALYRNKWILWDQNGKTVSGPVNAQ